LAGSDGAAFSKGRDFGAWLGLLPKQIWYPKANRIETMKGPAESGQICSVGRRKIAGDLGNVIEATSIGGRRSDFLTAGKLAPGHLGLLQQYLPKAESCAAANRMLIR
jgi:hypothetical protein